jgi:hypothetical protein
MLSIARAWMRLMRACSTRLERDEREQAEQTRIRRLMDDPVSALEERGWDAQDPAGVLAPGREAAYRARWGQR